MTTLLPALACARGITLKTLYARRRNWGSLERAMSEPPVSEAERKRRASEAISRGSISEQARLVGLSPTCVHQRIRKGKSIHAALSEPLVTSDERKQRREAANRERHKNSVIVKLARETGLSRTTIFMRLKKGWTEDKIISTPAMTRVEASRLGGSKSVVAARARANGLDPNVVTARIRKGCPKEMAYYPAMTNAEASKLGVAAMQKKYENSVIRRLMQSTGLSHSTVYKRLKSGWSEEKILANPGDQRLRNTSK